MGQRRKFFFQKAENKHTHNECRHPMKGKAAWGIEWVLLLIVLGPVVLIAVVLGVLFFRFDVSRPAQALQPDPRFADLRG